MEKKKNDNQKLDLLIKDYIQDMKNEKVPEKLKEDTLKKMKQLENTQSNR
ncbi:MAG: hypothetical protein RR945_05680 [Erysipelotrichaceae bacterium]